MDEKEEEMDKSDESCEPSTAVSTDPGATNAESVHNDNADSVATSAVPEGGHAREKTGALVGKINNLVTTDLLTIEHSYRIVEIRSFTTRYSLLTFYSPNIPAYR